MGPISSFRCFFVVLLIFSFILQAFMYWCPKGWMNYRYSCYGYHQEHLSWHDAEADCYSYDVHGHLASILSHNEMQLISRWILKTFKTGKPIWIGMYSAGAGMLRRRWRWIDLAAVHYTNWKESEPDNRNNTEHCVMMSYQSGTLQWSDTNCSLPLSYLCKISH
ncbi:rheacalcin-1-like [Liasis olivaceus]